MISFRVDQHQKCRHDGTGNGKDTGSGLRGMVIAADHA